MTGDTHVDVPEEFDALLREALSVEPSPAFLPRVRARISAESQSGHWNWRLGLAGAAGVAVCVVAVAVSTMSNGVPAPPLAPQAPVLQDVRPVAGLAVPQAVNAPVPKPLYRHTPGPPTAPAAMPSPDLRPVVIVDERQRTALTTVLQMVSDGRLTERAFEHTTPTSMLPIRDRVVPIGVKPMEVSPVAAGGVLQSEK